MARARTTPALPTAKVIARNVGSSVVLTPATPRYDDAFRRMVSGEPREFFERSAQGRSERRTRLR